MILAALKTVLDSRAYRLITAFSFVVFLLIYLTTLPASYTGGYSSLEALEYLNATLVGFSVLMAALVALLTPMIIYLVRQGQKASKGSAAGGVLIGILAPILCCSPLLPLLMGFIAALIPTLFGTLGVQVQGFIATHQIELFSAASLLLFVALYQNAKKVTQGVCCKV